MFQNANNGSGPLGAGALTQEGREVLTVNIEHFLIVLNQVLQDRRCCGLQEGTTHTLLQGRDCLADGANVGLQLAGQACELRSLLLTDGCGLRDGGLGCRPIGLCLFQILLELAKLALGFLDSGWELGNLGLGICNARREVTSAVLAVAHELVEELLFLLSLCLNLLLHHLQHVHHLADGVGSCMFLSGLKRRGQSQSKEECRLHLW